MWTYYEDEMFPSSGNSGKCYSQPLFGSFASSESLETKSSDSYGAYESFGLGSLNTEDADSVFDNSNGGYSDTCSSTWGADVLSNWDRPFVMSSQRSRSPFLDSGRESQYSTSNLSDSSSLYSPSHSRSAPIGSRGRDMHPYVHRNYRGRGAVVPEAKGQDCSSQNPSICIESYYSKSAALVFRGTKRKMMEPVPPCKMVKKKRIVRATPSIIRIVGPHISKDSCISSETKEINKEHELGKKVRAREKRRRRREKNHEKYGEKHRWAFTCAFCKFHTFEDKDIEKHFGSTYHRETLDYIRRQAKFDDKVISFLHDCMVHKFHKTVSTLHKLKFSCGRSKDDWAKIMEGVTEDDYMRRMEVVYCVACDIHIPAVFSSVQQHLHSLTHLKSKVAYKEQLKRDSVVTAKAIINNDNVKVRYEKYMKGEDPFAIDANNTSSDSQDPEKSDEAEEDEENSDS
ncbi:DBIRD complex subunit ZNF326 isoform X1 [Sinocyclocheilus rhinocerous]|uniref:DBIRD complex subunit ZNF326 isoform X1 n=1 Tax=Sinocyclocheilus rhinocerous TaxID=307959 RepID=UPI0007B8010C|nr:PREDICTED: DBIRD complex subunit ZNF326-like isoform X1 [Sinocyclocheilus rhinocerous]